MTELETASTPNLDALAGQGITGLHLPAGAGITPGSGTGHLGLFGYDPLLYYVGRGVLSALGIDFPLQPGDVAARGNFCTLNAQGLVTDRRAARISSEINEALCQDLRRGISLPGAELVLQTVKEHRFLLVLRGSQLSPAIADTDPQVEGEPPRAPRPQQPQAEHTAGLLQRFLEQAQQILAERQPANGVLLRGFSSRRTGRR